VCALRWSDIDLDGGIVHFRRAIKQVGSRMIEGDTKTHQERSVALPPQAVDQLRGYRLVLDGLADDPFVVSPVPDHGKPYTPDAVSRMFRRIARAAGQPYHLHQLRHFSATQAIAAGLGAVSVAARLSLADASVTLRVYAHAVEARDHEAGDFLGGLVMPAAAPRA
jgi:integrase